jgi:hypothetical protein
MNGDNGGAKRSLVDSMAEDLFGFRPKTYVLYSAPYR